MIGCCDLSLIKNKMNVRCHFIFFVFCWLQTSWTVAELYTAVVDLENLLKTEMVLMETMQHYIKQQEMKLDVLKKQVAHYAEEHEKAIQNPTEYLANPINAYLLVKRLTNDWKATESLMKTDVYQTEIAGNFSKLQQDVDFPTDEDLSGAAAALTRLQDTYNLDTESLARGELNGIKYSAELSSDDCYELGRQSYYNDDYYHTVLWMREALRKHEIEQNDKTFKWEILEYLAYSIYMQGNVQLAAQLTRELLAIHPQHEIAKGNLQYYEKLLQAEEQGERKRGEEGSLDEASTKNSKLMQKYEYTSGERTKYEMICRKEIEMSEKEKSELKCRYVHKNNPFLLIAPLKEEEAYLSPRIVLYRKAIYSNEIETIKSIAKPRLKRATVQNHKTGKLETAHYRISKSAWLQETEDPVIATVRRRVEDITSLTVETAEELQVVNYGIGGHYEPHFDFARAEEKYAFKSLGTGNRIATVLFYMSDVAQGGATVFPLLNLALWPEKGSVAFWHNLHPSGVGDSSTRHAACPVLQGSKWVSNVWLHEKGQELLRLCDPADPSIAIAREESL